MAKRTKSPMHSPSSPDAAVDARVPRAASPAKQAAGRPARAQTSARRSKAAVLEPVTGSKLDRLSELLSRSAGASIAEMMEATHWQSHSVRGALAGALKRRGLAITSEKSGGERRYHAAPGR
jgi:hypothetical protein